MSSPTKFPKHRSAVTNEELPELEAATVADLRLAAKALGSLARYGGFMRATLAGIYAERNRKINEWTKKQSEQQSPKQ